MRYAPPMKRTPSVEVWLAALGLLLLLAGCQTTPKVNVETDKQAAFAAYHTYHLMDLPAQIPGGDPGLMLRLRDTIETTIHSTLTGKGYQAVPREQADMAVVVRGEIVPKVDVHDWGYSPGMSWGYRRHGSRYVYGTSYSSLDVDAYHEGLLAVEVYDNQTKRQVWVGWSQARTDRKSVDSDRVATALREILMRYPDVQP